MTTDNSKNNQPNKEQQLAKLQQTPQQVPQQTPQQAKHWGGVSSKTYLECMQRKPAQLDIEEYTIKWSNPAFVNFKADKSADKPIEVYVVEDLDSWNSTGFYVIFAGTVEDKVDATKKYKEVTPKKLLYIGKAYGQSIKGRIEEEHEGVYDEIRGILKSTGYKAFAKAGIIVDYPPKKQQPEDIYIDIEALLIYDNNKSKPLLNTNNTKSYKGRSLIVKNDGCPQIKEISSSKGE